MFALMALASLGAVYAGADDPNTCFTIRDCFTEQEWKSGWCESNRQDVQACIDTVNGPGHGLPRLRLRQLAQTTTEACQRHDDCRSARQSVEQPTQQPAAPKLQNEPQTIQTCQEAAFAKIHALNSSMTNEEVTRRTEAISAELNSCEARVWMTR